jgi:hypothetical protein
VSCFCKACSVDTFGKDFRDLAGQVPEDDVGTDLCEGCGAIFVNHDGDCLSTDCLCKGQPGHGVPHPAFIDAAGQPVGDAAGRHATGRGRGAAVGGLRPRTGDRVTETRVAGGRRPLPALRGRAVTWLSESAADALLVAGGVASYLIADESDFPAPADFGGGGPARVHPGGLPVRPARVPPRILGRPDQEVGGLAMPVSGRCDAQCGEVRPEVRLGQSPPAPAVPPVRLRSAARRVRATPTPRRSPSSATSCGPGRRAEQEQAPSGRRRTSPPKPPTSDLTGGDCVLGFARTPDRPPARGHRANEERPPVPSTRPGRKPGPPARPAFDAESPESRAERPKARPEPPSRPAAAEWPFQKGQTVYYITSAMGGVGGGGLASGSRPALQPGPRKPTPSSRRGGPS